MSKVFVPDRGAGRKSGSPIYDYDKTWPGTRREDDLRTSTYDETWGREGIVEQRKSGMELVWESGRKGSRMDYVAENEGERLKECRRSGVCGKTNDVMKTSEDSDIWLAF